MARVSLILCFLFLAMMNSSLILHSSALQIVVGGQDGWVLNPKESYDHWAQRLRFQVNDTLLFRYSNTTDSVLAVSKSDYDNCNVNNPVIQLYGGESIFKFGHSGPFYFITGNKTNCDNGQKVLILVLAVRSPPASPTTPPPPTTPPSAAPSPSGSVPPPPTTPPSAAPSPSGSDPPPPASSPSPSPSGSVPPPASSPSPSGLVPPPASSPSPSPSGSGSGSVPPTSSPASSPAAQTPMAGSPSPLVSPASTPIGPGGGNAPADINAPTASQNTSSATATFTPAVSTLTVSFVFIMALGGSTIFY